MTDRKQEKGETLIESLAAILIFTFGSIAMLTMISGARDINRRVREADVHRTQWQNRAEMASGTQTGGTVRIQIGGDSQRLRVDVFGDAEEGYVFYLEDDP